MKRSKQIADSPYIARRETERGREWGKKRDERERIAFANIEVSKKLSREQNACRRGADRNRGRWRSWNKKRAVINMMPPVRDDHESRGSFLSQQHSSHLTGDHHSDQMSQMQSGSPQSNNVVLSKAELRKVSTPDGPQGLCLKIDLPWYCTIASQNSFPCRVRPVVSGPLASIARHRVSPFKHPRPFRAIRRTCAQRLNRLRKWCKRQQTSRVLGDPRRYQSLLSVFFSVIIFTLFV